MFEGGLTNFEIGKLGIQPQASAKFGNYLNLPNNGDNVWKKSNLLTMKRVNRMY